MATTNTTAQSRDSASAKETQKQGAAPAKEQERALQTGKEGTSSTGVARRGQTSPVYGPNALSESPFHLMRRMAEDMDRLFDNFGFGSLGLGSSLAPRLSRDLWSDRMAGVSSSVWSPQIESFRRGDKLVVRADLPGLNKDDVTVEIDDGILTISGERSEEHEDRKDDFYRSERSYGRFYRALPLPDGVTDEQCEATFRDGVLEVSLNAPKDSERKAKRIQIR